MNTWRVKFSFNSSKVFFGLNVGDHETRLIKDIGHLVEQFPGSRLLESLSGGKPPFRTAFI